MLVDYILAKRFRKAQAKLNQRQADYDDLPAIDKDSRKRPGSMNRHKQVSAETRQKKRFR